MKKKKGFLGTWRAASSVWSIVDNPILASRKSVRRGSGIRLAKWHRPRRTESVGISTEPSLRRIAACWLAARLPHFEAFWLARTPRSAAPTTLFRAALLPARSFSLSLSFSLAHSLAGKLDFETNFPPMTGFPANSVFSAHARASAIWDYIISTNYIRETSSPDASPLSFFLPAFSSFFIFHFFCTFTPTSHVFFFFFSSLPFS